MSSINSINLLGNIGSLHINEGVIRLSLATSRSFKNNNGELQKVTQWHAVNIYGKDAEYLKEQRQIKVGDSLTIINGRVEYNEVIKNNEKVRYANIICHYKTQIRLETKRESVATQEPLSAQHYLTHDDEIEPPLEA